MKKELHCIYMSVSVFLSPLGPTVVISKVIPPRPVSHLDICDTGYDLLELPHQTASSYDLGGRLSIVSCPRMAALT